MVDERLLLMQGPVLLVKVNRLLWYSRPFACSAPVFESHSHYRCSIVSLHCVQFQVQKLSAGPVIDAILNCEPLVLGSSFRLLIYSNGKKTLTWPCRSGSKARFIDALTRFKDLNAAKYHSVVFRVPFLTQFLNDWYSSNANCEFLAGQKCSILELKHSKLVQQRVIIGIWCSDTVGGCFCLKTEHNDVEVVTFIFFVETLRVRCRSACRCSFFDAWSPEVVDCL